MLATEQVQAEQPGPARQASVRLSERAGAQCPALAHAGFWMSTCCGMLQQLAGIHQSCDCTTQIITISRSAT